MIEGVHFVRSRRPGRSIVWYVYAWRGGPCIQRTESPTKPKLTTQAVSDLIECRERQRIPAESMAALVRDWRYRSPEWASLAPSTQKTWGSHLDTIEDKWGATPLTVWNDPRMVAKVVAWRDSMKDTPRTADIAVTVLSRLLDWGRLRARVHFNVAAGIPGLYRGADRADIIWTEDDMNAFCRSALILDRPLMIDCLFLAAWTGMRLADLAAVTFSDCGPEALVQKPSSVVVASAVELSCRSFLN